MDGSALLAFPDGRCFAPRRPGAGRGPDSGAKPGFGIPPVALSAKKPTAKERGGKTSKMALGATDFLGLASSCDDLLQKEIPPRRARSRDATSWRDLASLAVDRFFLYRLHSPERGTGQWPSDKPYQESQTAKDAKERQGTPSEDMDGSALLAFPTVDALLRVAPAQAGAQVAALNPDSELRRQHCRQESQTAKDARFPLLGLLFFASFAVDFLL